MIDFSIKVKLPSGTEIRVPELNNKVYLSLVKYCENADYEGFNDTIHSFIKIPSNLDILDRFYLLIYYRMLFISEHITIQGDDKTIEYNLDAILKNIEAVYRDFNSNIVINEFTITVGLPTILYFKDIDSLYNNIIKTITYKDTRIDFSTASKEEQEFILSYLPSGIFNKLKQYIDNLSDILTNFILIDKIEDVNIDQYKLDIISNGIISFLCSIYTTNLLNCYEVMYSYIANISQDAEFYNSLSPIETKIMINIRNREIEKQNEELNSQRT